MLPMLLVVAKLLPSFRVQIPDPLQVGFPGNRRVVEIADHPYANGSAMG
jgi:hypothetical protein